jgi:hypothetical protein
MSWEPRTPSERAMVLAAITGLKLTYGPTLLLASSRRPWARYFVVAAMGELVLDKLGVLPSRSHLSLLIPRALAGAWVAREVMRAHGADSPWTAPMGAAVAAGTAVLAPRIRAVSQKHLAIPDPLLGLVEDWVALHLGTRAVDVPMDRLAAMTRQAIVEVQQEAVAAIQPATSLSKLSERPEPPSQRPATRDAVARECDFGQRVRV